MNEAVTLALAWLAGLALGALFFGGLWWTVRAGITARRPALWFLGSLLFRMGIALAGFYAVSAGNLNRLLVCLFGFFIARSIVTRLSGAPGKSPCPTGAERHAP
jgi:F1F0 ATPase subunit 2